MDLDRIVSNVVSNAVQKYEGERSWRSRAGRQPRAPRRDGHGHRHSRRRWHLFRSSTAPNARAVEESGTDLADRGATSSNDGTGQVTVSSREGAGTTVSDQFACANGAGG